jgi:hypothetical protein
MRRVALAAVAAAGLSSVALVSSQAAGPPSASVTAGHVPTVLPAPFTGVHHYRLITGQRVRVMSRADGTTTATLPGRQTYRRFGTADHVYVVPHMPRAELDHLDLSLFDTRALAVATRRDHGRVPVVVRLRPDARAARIAGLRLDHAGARTAGRSEEIRGSFGQAFAGLTRADLRGVARIRLDAPRTPQPRTSATTHQVQVTVTTKSGAPAPDVDVALVNVDDILTYAEAHQTNNSGVARFEVPDGDYSAIGSTFTRVVLDPDFTVAADTSVALDLGDATVHPSETVPGHRRVVAAVSVSRFSQIPYFPWTTSYVGGPVHVRLQPTSGKVAHGWLFSGAGGTFVRGSAPHYADVAATEDVVKGVPSDFTIVHHRRDFARVVDRFHANGPDRSFPISVEDADGRVDLIWDPEVSPEARVPGKQVMLLEAGPRKWFDRSLTYRQNEVLQTVDRFPRPGSHHVVQWARGPVGPGLEGHRDFGDGAWRYRNQLDISIPLFSGAGSTMDGFLRNKDGAWSLRSAHHVYAHGHHQILTFGTKVPHGPRRYVLTAASHPSLPFWQLSTDVQDVWTFHSSRPASSTAEKGLPLLMPSYVAPQNSRNEVDAGPTSYRLTFTSPAPQVGRIHDSRVQLSTDDGHTWRSATLTRLSPSAFRVHYRTPAAHGDVRYLSVRVTGRDDHGDSVEETALRAYRLR